MGDSDATKRRTSERGLKRKTISEDARKEEKKPRSCEKIGCYDASPTCCLTSEHCTGSGNTSRWYHMSLGEHFCNNCFDNYYRVGKPGNERFSAWCHEWGNVSRVSKPTIKCFVANELLPYWLKCCNSKCGKWRLVKSNKILDPEFVKTFSCSNKENGTLSCNVPEDLLVSSVLESNFMDQLVEEPLLQNSPASPYLSRFLLEDIGICPTNENGSILEEQDNIKPFYLGQCGETHVWVKPDKLANDEQDIAEQLHLSPATYLGLRNLIVAVWNLSPSEWLTIEKLNQYLLCRGLVRISLHSATEKIVDFLTMKAIINYGIITSPLSCNYLKDVPSEIFIVGAGISGLAAAKHLQNLGLNVVVLEASSVLGGRSNYSGLGFFFVEGLLNNPFTILAMQAGKRVDIVGKSVMLFNSAGEQIPSSLIEKVTHELNGLIHGAIEWATMNEKDSDWYNTILTNFQDIKKISPSYSDYDLFHFCLNQYEIGIKANMKMLTLLNWEFVTPLLGDMGVIHDGFNLIIKKLAENVKINYNAEVTAIDFSNSEIEIATTKQKFKANRVLVTVPLTVLQENNIKFIPAFPDYKLKALKELGNYYCEQLTLEFPEKFWSKKVKGSFCRFGLVSSDQLFYLFTDVTQKKKKSVPTLVTIIPQESIEAMDKDSSQIVQNCVSVLQRAFSDSCSVPQPTNYYLTQWKDNDGSFGSFVKVGGTQKAFDDVATTIDNKIYFAGEGTFRNIPSTITGAYLSGLHAAVDIASDSQAKSSRKH